MSGRPRRRTLDDLTAKFGCRFWFGSAKMRDHTALTALRLDLSEPGVTCVITPDLAEMADALEQDAAGAPPDPPDSG